MKRYFIGFICLLYSFIIFYIKLSGIIGNFLAPQMQIYIIVSSIFLFIVGLVFIFSKDIHYKFSFFDIFLLMPIVMIFLAGDGRLSINLSNNRTNSFLGNIEVDEEIDNDKESSDIEIDSLDISKVDIEVIDQSYETLSYNITFNNNVDQFIGKTIKVRGFLKKEMSGVPVNYMALGKYLISCCAADASYAGFIISYDKSKVIDNEWYEIIGVLDKSRFNGMDIAIIKVVEIKKIDSKKEELYIYPCYSYDNSYCDIEKKYKIKGNFNN